MERAHREVVDVRGADHGSSGTPGATTRTGALQRRAAAAPAAAAPASTSATSSAASGSSGVIDDPFALHLDDVAVQRRGDGHAPGDVHALAEAGVAGNGGSLPFLEQIQSSFGGHDVTGVRAHTDGAAASASAAIGAQAYARGSDVAFGTTADLHTAAHEAAHVVQQRGGVQLKSGVGEEGDAYERHADAVADRVVAGESAEALLSTMAGSGGGGAAVQRQVANQAPAADGGAAAPAPAAAAGAPGAAPAAGGGQVDPRMQAAISAGDLPAVLAAQRDLRAQVQAQPTAAADARAGMAAGRHWMMERVAALRDQFAPRVAAASGAPEAAAPPAADSGAAAPAAAPPAAGGHAQRRRPAADPGRARSPLESVDNEMDEACAPYLTGLMDGDPQFRYEHPDHEITEKVFAAVRLHSVRRGVSRIGHRDEAEAEARQHGRVGGAAPWCGAFAFTQAEVGGGMDPHWRSHMAGEGGIRSALRYGGMRNVWIWDGAAWQRLRDYHASRGSVRLYEEIAQGPPPHGILPGDIVLIDNSLGTNPDHITTAISFDGRYLTTLGGNQGGGEAGVSRSGRPLDLTENPTPNDVRARDAAGNATRERDPSRGPKHVRVHGAGRWSIVDYERHIYVTSAEQPTAPPSESDQRSHS